mmetsp:Transcript_8991/g.20614  ORF Transcript_8991/g.20614 Transcript_8991/m.20614 type:complete len:100 (+) Transcript_8991:1614-1913(+)
MYLPNQHQGNDYDGSEGQNLSLSQYDYSKNTLQPANTTHRARMIRKMQRLLPAIKFISQEDADGVHLLAVVDSSVETIEEQEIDLCNGSFFLCCGCSSL